MKTRIPVLFMIAGCLLLLTTACENPATGKPEAQVSEPEAAAQPAVVEGREFAISADSKISFVGSKVTGSHDGGFHSFAGTVSVVDGNPESASVQVTIDATSLWSDNEKLTGHLKSPDFFDVETYPTATFASTAIAANDDGTYTMTGTLDLHGVTKQISFPASIDLTESGFTASAEFAIKRFDFGVVYPGMPDDLIRDDVLIKLDLQSVAAGGNEVVDDEGEAAAGH